VNTSKAMNTQRNMRARAKATLLAVLVGAALVPSAAVAQAPVPGPCQPGALPGGALSLICVPDAGWNGELVVFAHGYVPVGLPLNFYSLTLADGTFLPAVVQGLGYAFATTSYRQNGLAILEGVDDVRELVAAFEATYSAALRTHLAGVSEGGLVAALLAERSPELFSSALAACAPIGSFVIQTDYLGDFRVLFDYFFPGVIPGSPIDIPASVIANWDTVYVPRITAALASRPKKALELMKTARAAYDPANPATIANTTINVLRYNVFGMNDAAAKLGGNPFDNHRRLYFGSSDDLRLNLRVRRVVASPVARAALRAYQTTGQLSIPLVTLHTVADEVVPVRHELLYLAKVDPVFRGTFIPIPAFRYGHCNFTANEVLGAFAVAVRQP
jgi:pimeloyl-ACP methyl ester carboxylesterase